MRIELWTTCEVLKMQQYNFYCHFWEIMKALVYTLYIVSARRMFGVCTFGPKNPKRAVALKPSLICIQAKNTSSIQFNLPYLEKFIGWKMSIIDLFTSISSQLFDQGCIPLRLYHTEKSGHLTLLHKYAVIFMLLVNIFHRKPWFLLRSNKQPR